MLARLTLELTSPHECQDSVALIVPIAPTTEHQQQSELEISGAAAIDSLKSNCGTQSAYVVTSSRDTPMRLTYGIDLCKSGACTRSESQMRAPALTPEITERLRALLKTATTMSERERRIIAFAAEHFSYGPLASTPLAEQLVCGLGSGNCIDINGFLLSAFNNADIPARYYAGYYFPTTDQPVNADGMHCWLSTEIEGVRRYWDVPYLLKRGAKELNPGLEALGGAYVAMSIGMNLTFDLGGTSYHTRYLAHPVWLLPNGTTQAATVNCRACFPRSGGTSAQRNDPSAKPSSQQMTTRDEVKAL